MPNQYFSISVYASDGRPVQPVHVADYPSLDAAKARVDRTIANTANPETFSAWTEKHGQHFRESNHYGYLIEVFDVER